ncbi:MAG: FAD:protein FMN transferase [Eubacteriales bacterium]|nr:FAD:protein FMN transferase [Eubacteriales bacterium]
MKKLILIIAILPILLSGCNEYKEKQDIIFGTSAQIIANKGDIDKSIGLAKDIENLMSVNIETSDISKINQHSGVKAVKVDKSIINLVESSMEYTALSEGNFDVTIYPLVALWGIGTIDPKVPNNKQLRAAIDLCGIDKMKTTQDSIFLTKKGMGIDLGGIAKGYAADKMAEALMEDGCTSGIINLGGNIRLIGGKTNGEPWKIGVQDPDKSTGEYIGYLTLRDSSIATSGDYQRYFTKSGVRYHHILDPKTGYPAKTDIRSATIITDSAQKADALSTVAFMLGSDKTLKLLEKLPNTDGIIITKNGTSLLTSNAKSLFYLKDTVNYRVFPKN